MLTLPVMYLLTGLVIAGLWLIFGEDKAIDKWGENELMTLGIMALFWPLVVPAAILLWVIHWVRSLWR